MTPHHILVVSVVVLAWSFLNVHVARELHRKAVATREETEDLLSYIEHLRGHDDDS